MANQNLGEEEQRKLKILESRTYKSQRASKQATIMALVHNLLIRGMNAIWQQGHYVQKPADVVDFLDFIDACIFTLKIHHSGEEEAAFPVIERSTGLKGIMDESVSEHHAFQQGLNQLSLHVKAIQEGNKAYNGEEVVGLLEVFAGPLLAHLENEIVTFEGLEKYHVDWDLFMQEFSAHIERAGHPVSLVTAIDRQALIISAGNLTSLCS
jgi:hemerythrin-like domain-containing protein